MDYSGIQLPDCVYHVDPLVWPNASPVSGVKFWQDSLLIPSTNMPVTPWVRFRPAVAEISYTPWNALTNFAAGDTCFSAAQGISYIALLPSSGVDPAVSGDTWFPVTIPTMFFKYLQWQCAGFLTSEQEGRVRGEKFAMAEKELERLKHLFIQMSGDHPRMRWRGRKQLTPIGVQQTGVLGISKGYY
jgi:hypothetical protein